LTARELEVLKLVAGGRSNREIAAGAVRERRRPSRRTSRTLSKLGLRDRVQAVVFAYESGLVEPGAD
jgi:DNA-binding NarL/FixJ family response regulator